MVSSAASTGGASGEGGLHLQNRRFLRIECTVTWSSYAVSRDL